MIDEMVLHYRIIEELGRGGMGVVYKAMDTKLDRPVALKFLPPDLAKDETDLARLVREAKAAAALNHANVCTVHDIHTADDRPFIVMEYVEGKSLRAVTGESTGLLADWVIEYGMQIAAALQAAHSKGIIHRDIKPENIMVTETGQIKVMDFGLARLRGSVKLTRSSSTMGTLAYMSPEQIQGQEADVRSDIFSFGVLLYEMSTGQLPFKGEYEPAVIYSILNEEPEPIQRYRTDLSSGFLHLVDRSLEKRPDDRYQSMDELLKSMKESRRDSGETDVKPPAKAAVSSAPKRPRAGKIALRLMTGVLGLAVVLFALDLLQKGGEKKPFEHMRLTRLTSHGRAKEAVVSSDGRYIVHVMREAGGESLWLRQVATSSNVQILPPEEAELSGLVISPDGDYIYYLVQTKNRMTNTLCRLPILGGTPVTMLENVDSPVAFSPDGKRLCFLRYAPFPTDISVMLAGSDGSELQVLARSKFPDIYNPAATPAWSPDGEFIVCADQSTTDKVSRLVAINISDGSETHFCSQKWSSVNRIVWFRDGSGLLMTAKVRSANHQIWRISYPGGATIRITNDLNEYSGVSLTSDGGSLITVQSELRSSIWIAPFGRAVQAQQIVSGRFDGAKGIAWTPDCKIIHASWDNKLWLFDANGGNIRQLTPEDRQDFAPAVSPDGKTVYFTSIQGNILELWKMNRNGTNPAQLAPLSAYPQCSPDGGWIVYGALIENGIKIMKMSTLDGNASLLMGRTAFGPAISPDGRKIACYLGDETEFAKMKIAVIPFVGGEPDRIFNLPNDILPDSWLRWAPDGHSVTYIIDQGGVSNIWQQPLDGGPAEQLTEYKQKQIFSFDWSRDGVLACSRGEIDHDVLLIKSVDHE